MTTYSPEGHHVSPEKQPPADMQPAVEVAQSQPTPETQAEQLHQRERPMQVQEQKSSIEDAIQSMRRSLGLKKKKKPTQIPQVRNDMTVRIEKIMEEGLEEAFQELSPVEAQEFKIKGEEVAIQIQHMLRSSHVRVKKVFRLLFSWLQLLPGVNRFFLEQEAKIKTDKIVSLHSMKQDK